MEQLLVSFSAGVVVSAIVFFFVWKNNKAWFTTASDKVDEILAMAKAGTLDDAIKAKLEALAAEIKAKK